MSQRIFLCQTLYHALLSSCIAAECGNDEGNSLLFMPNIYQAEALFRQLVPAEVAPFRTVGSLLARNPVSRLGQWSAEWRALPKVRSLAQASPASEVYVFNDSSPSVQYFCRYIPRGSSMRYVEDGLGAYSSWLFRSSARRESVLRLIYGSWYQRPLVLGTSLHFDSIHATFPQHLRPEILGAPVFGINPRFARGLEPSLAFGVPDVLLMPAFSGHIADSVHYTAKLSGLVKWFRENGISVGIKYHPVEDPRRYLDLPHDVGVITFPQQVPVEVLLLSARGRVKCLIGDASTGLLAARWLFDEMLVICAGGLRGVDQDPLLKATFRSVGIQEALDLSGLKSICTAHFRTC